MGARYIGDYEVAHREAGDYGVTQVMDYEVARHEVVDLLCKPAMKWWTLHWTFFLGDIR